MKGLSSAPFIAASYHHQKGGVKKKAPGGLLQLEGKFSGPSLTQDLEAPSLCLLSPSPTIGYSGQTSSPERLSGAPRSHNLEPGKGEREDAKAAWASALT